MTEMNKGLRPRDDRAEGAAVVETGAIEPPTFVSGGRRLNFNREEGWGEDRTYSETFSGYGKDDSCYPSCSWEELCALADLVVKHPAFRLPETVSTYSPPRIEDKPS